MSGHLNILRYELQVKEPYTYSITTGKPVPVHTYRWKTKVCADNLAMLQRMILNPENCRIEDRQTGEYV